MSRVALVHNVDLGESERQTEFDSPATIGMLQDVIAEQHDCRPIEATQDMAWIPELVEYQPDIIFNVAEGFQGAAREAVYPAIFEQLGLAYCGPDPTNLLVTLNKHLTKQLVGGIPGLEVPRSYLWNEAFDPVAVRRGKYMLKLMHEGSSIGMQLVQNPEEVPDKARALQTTYADNILIEEFVEGEDISMAYVGGLGVFGPAQVTLPGDDFYDYGLKSARDTEVQIGAYALPARLKQKLQAVTAALVEKIDLKGYGKVDLRLQDDTVHLIEVNGQVSFHPNGEFAHCCLADGHQLGDVIHTIINTGLATRRRPSVGVRI